MDERMRDPGFCRDVANGHFMDAPSGEELAGGS
jgi:hypothetical protein